MSNYKGFFLVGADGKKLDDAPEVGKNKWSACVKMEDGNCGLSAFNWSVHRGHRPYCSGLTHMT